MTIQTAPTIEYYHDSHETEEDLISDSMPQDTVHFYLAQVLKWQFRAEGW